MRAREEGGGGSRYEGCKAPRNTGADEMWGRYFTSPLQACSFHQNTAYIRRIFLSVLMTKFSACIGNVPHDFNKEFRTLLRWKLVGEKQSPAFLSRGGSGASF